MSVPSRYRAVAGRRAPSSGARAPRVADLMRELDEPDAVPSDNGWAVGYLDILLVMLTLLASLLGIAYMRMGEAEAETERQVGFLLSLPAVPTAVELDEGVVRAAVQALIPPAARAVAVAAAKVPEPAHLELPLMPAPLVPAGLWLDGEAERLAQLVSAGADEHFELIIGDDQIRLEVRDDILFGSGRADLGHAGREILRKLAAGLVAENLDLAVEGHTDDRPIATARFPSNWELSTYRATTVARFLIEQGIPAKRIQVTGYADTRPLVANDSDDNRARNRRVSIVLQAPEYRRAGPKNGIATATNRHWATL